METCCPEPMVWASVTEMVNLPRVDFCVNVEQTCVLLYIDVKIIAMDLPVPFMVCSRVSFTSFLFKHLLTSATFTLSLDSILPLKGITLVFIAVSFREPITNFYMLIPLLYTVLPHYDKTFRHGR